MKFIQKDLNWNKIIFHIDYDSFFASVEQQANPFFRNKPVGVTGGPSLNKSIITAASIQAKKVGIKTGTPVFEARKIYPRIILVPSDFKKYNYVFEESQKIFDKYSDNVEPFSIDESFLDATQTAKFFGGPEKAAIKIKQDILKNFGPVITGSIGIGPNKLLAKLVSDFNKPNGIFRVTKENLNKVLRSVKLTDFCGIGHRINARLNNMGINSIEDLQKTSLDTLYKNFGNVGSKFLKNLSFGANPTEVDNKKYTAQPKSIGHQHTLAEKTRDPRRHLYKLSEMVGRRLRKNEMVGKTILVYLRDTQRRGYFQKTTLFKHIDSSWEIYKYTEMLTLKMSFRNPIKFIGVYVSNLKPKAHTTLPLFPEAKRLEKVVETADMINNKFGEFTIFPACTLSIKALKKEGSSFLQH